MKVNDDAPNYNGNAHCPDCGKPTEWVSTITKHYGDTTLRRFQALCGGCQADRSVERAYAEL